MNATEAARRAGYKGNDVTLGRVGSENVRKPLIKKEIDKRLKKANKAVNLTVETVLRNIQEVYELAKAAGQLSTAAKCNEQFGRYLKMYTDRIEHVQNIDEMSVDDLTRLLNEVIKGGNVDLSGLITGNGADHSGLPDPARNQKAH